MDIKSALNVVSLGLDFVEAVTGGEGQDDQPYGVRDTANTVMLIASVLENVRTRLADSGTVATSTNQALIKDYATRLSAVNDLLAAEVDET